MSQDNSLLVACGDVVVVAATRNAATAGDVAAAGCGWGYGFNIMRSHNHNLTPTYNHQGVIWDPLQST